MKYSALTKYISGVYDIGAVISGMLACMMLMFSIIHYVGILEILYPGSYQVCWELITRVHSMDDIREWPWFGINTECIYLLYILICVACNGHMSCLYFAYTTEYAVVKAVWLLLSELCIYCSDIFDILYVIALLYGYGFVFFALLLLICLFLCVSTLRMLIAYSDTVGWRYYLFIVLKYCSWFVLCQYIVLCVLGDLIFPVTHDALIELLYQRGWNSTNEHNTSFREFVYLNIAHLDMVFLHVTCYMIYYWTLCCDIALYYGLYAEWVWVSEFLADMLEVREVLLEDAVAKVLECNNRGI